MLSRQTPHSWHLHKEPINSERHSKTTLSRSIGMYRKKTKKQGRFPTRCTVVRTRAPRATDTGFVTTLMVEPGIRHGDLRRFTGRALAGGRAHTERLALPRSWSNDVLMRVSASGYAAAGASFLTNASYVSHPMSCPSCIVKKRLRGNGVLR
jgi:hypothetical protein